MKDDPAEQNDDEWEECDDDEEDDDEEEDEAPELVPLDENGQPIPGGEWAYVSGSDDEEEDGDDGWTEMKDGSDNDCSDSDDSGEEDDDDDDDEEEFDDDDEEEEDEDGVVSDEGEGPEDGGRIAANSVTPTVVPRDARNRVDARRILTTEDFELIERLKVAQAERSRDPKRRTGGPSGTGLNSAMAKIEARKREREEDNEEAGGLISFAVSPASLGAGMKTGRTSKVERIRHVLEGRKESKFEHNGHAGGLTNKEKLRKKNYMMVRKGKVSVKNKIGKSNSDVRWDKMHAVSFSISSFSSDIGVISRFSSHTLYVALIVTYCRRSNLEETSAKGDERNRMVATMGISSNDALLLLFINIYDSPPISIEKEIEIHHHIVVCMYIPTTDLNNLMVRGIPITKT